MTISAVFSGEEMLLLAFALRALRTTGRSTGGKSSSLLATGNGHRRSASGALHAPAGHLIADFKPLAAIVIDNERHGWSFRDGGFRSLKQPLHWNAEPEQNVRKFQHVRNAERLDRLFAAEDLHRLLIGIEYDHRDDIHAQVFRHFRQ